MYHNAWNELCKSLILFQSLFQTYFVYKFLHSCICIVSSGEGTVMVSKYVLRGTEIS